MKFKAISPGWIERTVVMRPKARLFTVLTVMWCVVSPTPADMLIQRQVSSASPLGIILWAIILAQLVFIVLAVCFRLKERQKTFKQRMPDPNFGLRL